MTGFNEIGLSKKALSAVQRMGYDTPTPVQEQSIPLILKGRDIIAAAKTGTGKTGAFGLPCMDRLPHAKNGSGPLMLVITPTRELAQQIGEVCNAIALSTHHRVCTVVGGLSYKPQIDRLAHGTDVLIATPGRLIDLMGQDAVRLSDVQVLVLDEADRMLDMGFLPSVKKITAALPDQRQTLLFSATIDRSITKSIGSLLRNPALVEIAHKGEVADTVTQYVIHTSQGAKPALLNAVLEEYGAKRVIVFARTRSRADSSCRRLKRAGFKAEAIHSDRSQNQRQRALDRFASGETNIITATDVLARGIDVEEVDYVINYDLPTQAEDYIHRIGRTGRAGQTGFAISFATPDTADALKNIEKLTRNKIPELELPNFDKQAAEAEAMQRTMSANARRDPEIAAAKSQQEKQRAKKSARRARARNERGKASPQPAKKADKPRQKDQPRQKSTNPAPDFRPGRSRRAAVHKQRQASKQQQRSKSTRAI